MGIKKENIYFENYARLLLCALCDFDKDNLFCTDRPDIQSRDRSVGIEVTRAVYEKEAELYGELKKIWDKPFDSIPFDKRKKLRQNYNIDVVDNQIKSASLKSGATKNNPEKLIKCISKKVDKLNGGGYAECDNYQLYVYVESMFLDGCEFYIQSVIDFMRRDTTLSYSMLYLDQWYVFYICDIKAGTYQKKKFQKSLEKR